MFDNKLPVELVEILMPFEALGCLKTKEELNQILEESISTGIENVHSVLEGSSYGVMFGDAEIYDGVGYHSLERTRKKRLIYNGNFTIGKSQDNDLRDLSVSRIFSEISDIGQDLSALTQYPLYIKDETGLSLDKTDTITFGDNASPENKRRLCKVKKIRAEAI